MASSAWSQIDSNRRKTWLLMFGFSAFIVAVAYIFSLAFGFEGPGALGFVGVILIISGLINLGSYYWSDKIVIGLSGGKLVTEDENKELYRLVENLCIASGLPKPKIYIIDDPAPNAFATGRDPNHAVVAFTTGILQRLDKLELEGVVAHELSHVKNYDTRLMSVVVVLVGLVALLADIFIRSLWFGGGRRKEGGAVFLVLGIAAAIIAPVAANLIKLAISRRREFLADSSGAVITRNPDGLATALAKISSDNNTLKHANNATAHLYIINPFKGEKAKSWFTGLFSTHPPMQERIEALRRM
jgi:heat shock protein HtpX